MRVIADLHLHSKYSRATSERLGLEGIAQAARTKGIDLIATGDFTHPAYFDELKKKLKPLGNGFYECAGGTFILSAEVSVIWSIGGGKAKRNHVILLAPALEVVQQVNDALAKKGNLASDGRPIFGMSSAALVELVMGVSRDCECIPAHAWTPWFSVFGSNSGFDSVEECFEDQAKHIHALETGLSSDPPMNWRLSALDKYALVSNSDSHSPEKIGREANVFEFEERDFSYSSLVSAIRTKDRKRFLSTIEFYPEEGKYHFDGHRACNVSLAPKKSLLLKNICPVCRKPLTVGVLHRVEELADRPEGFVPADAIPFKHFIPLQEILSKSTGKGASSQSVKAEYDKLITAFGNEFAALEGEAKRIEQVSGESVAQAVVRAREGRVRLTPGYDGVYGEIDFSEKAGRAESGKSQASLSEFL